MSEFSFKSSSAWMMMYFFVPPIMGAMFVIVAIMAWQRDLDFTMVAFIGGVGLWNLVFTVRAWGKWCVVEVDMGGVHLDSGGRRSTYAWAQVESCMPVRGRPLISWYQRSLYQLTLRNPNSVVFFVPGPSKPRPQGLWEPHYE
jgi:hypothetical protein